MLRNVSRQGIRFALYGKDLTSMRILKNGYYEPESILYLFNTARRREADIFLDIGANIGYYSLLATKTNDFAEIHAIEAHPDTYRQLLMQIKVNAFQNIITPHNIAASEKDGEVFIEHRGRSGSSVSVNKRQGTIAIKAGDLDSIFNFSGRNIAMKIDVEGHQIEALKGMTNLLSRNKVLLQVEIWGHRMDSFYYLHDIGFRCIYHIGDDFYFVNATRSKRNDGCRFNINSKSVKKFLELLKQLYPGWNLFWSLDKFLEIVGRIILEPPKKQFRSPLQVQSVEEFSDEYSEKKGILEKVKKEAAKEVIKAAEEEAKKAIGAVEGAAIKAAEEEAKEAIGAVEEAAIKAAIKAAEEEAKEAIGAVEEAAIKAAIKAAEEEAKEAIGAVEEAAIKAAIKAAEEEAKEAIGAVEEAAIKAAKEAAKEAIGAVEGSAKEAAKEAAKKAAKKAAKEATKEATKEAAKEEIKVAKEAAIKAAKEVVTEAAIKAAKEAAIKVVTEAAIKAAKEAAIKVVTEAVKKRRRKL